MRGRITTSIAVLGVVAIGIASLFFWGSNRDSPTVSAQEVVARACDGMAGLDSYDMITTMKMEQTGVPLDGTTTVKASVDGKDFQTSFTFPDGSMVEAIRVGDVDYERFTPGEAGWEVSKTEFTDITTPLEHLGGSPVCPVLSNVTLKGEEELDGVKVTVYTSEDINGVEKRDLENLGSSFEGEKHAKSHKYWVDGRGILVKYWEDRYTFAQFGADNAMTRFTFTTKFSGVGEANTITTPNVGS